MNVWIAGRDKPHRCPECWVCHRHGNWRSRAARQARWKLPRRCKSCGALTITTRLRGWDGIRLWGQEGGKA